MDVAFFYNKELSPCLFDKFDKFYSDSLAHRGFVNIGEPPSQSKQVVVNARVKP
jgi:hypothetical protein